MISIVSESLGTGERRTRRARVARVQNEILECVQHTARGMYIITTVAAAFCYDQASRDAKLMDADNDVKLGSRASASYIHREGNEIKLRDCG